MTLGYFGFIESRVCSQFSEELRVHCIGHESFFDFRALTQLILAHLDPFRIQKP